MNYLHTKHLSILHETFTRYQEYETLELLNFQEILRGIKYLNRGFEETPQLTNLRKMVASLVEKKWESTIDVVYREKLAYEIHIADEDDDDKWLKHTQDKYYEVCEQIDRERKRYELLVKKIREELNKSNLESN